MLPNYRTKIVRLVEAHLLALANLQSSRAVAVLKEDYKSLVPINEAQTFAYTRRLASLLKIVEELILTNRRSPLLGPTRQIAILLESSLRECRAASLRRSILRPYIAANKCASR
jgi:hypothetical protein